jgi:hypothetical protein
VNFAALQSVSILRIENPESPIKPIPNKMGFSFASIVEQNQNTLRFGRHNLDCSAGDNFRQLLASSHNPLACSTTGRRKALPRPFERK